MYAPRPIRRLRPAVFLVALTGAVLVGAPHALADQAIVTATGPLNAVAVSNDLNCAVNHVGDVAGEFYGNTACATLISLNGPSTHTVYGPHAIPAGGAATRTDFTQVSQSPVSGSGTEADPYKITTIVTAGLTGIELTEVDTYVAGQEQYRTDVTVKNTAAFAASGVLYRAGDCYLQDNDRGRGLISAARGLVACQALTSSANPNRVEEWLPLTPGSSFYEAGFAEVWGAIATGQPFNNTCLCTEEIDNGAGLSWNWALNPGQSAMYSHLTVFSPAGNRITMGKTADAGVTTPGGNDGYTVTATNTTAGATTLTQIVDTLPPGFTYAAGSSSGASTTDPTISGQTLVWNGNWPLAPGASVSLRFGVRASPNVGIYQNNVDGDATGSTLVGASGLTAGIVVATPPTVTGNPYATQILTCVPGLWPTGNTAGPIYAWTRNGQAIPGATNSTYTASNDDIGQQVACVQGMTYTTALILASAPVTVLGPPVNTVRPSISGGAAAGSLLRCSQGTWTNTPTGYAYTWHRGSSTIAGATTSSYRTTGADQGRALSCSVTATNLAGSSTADSRSINVPAALAATGGPRDVVLEKGPAGSFRIKVQYVLRTTVCGKTCRATAEIRVRNGSRIYYSSVATKLPGDGKVVLGTRSGLKLPAGKKVYFYLTVSKAALLRAPFKTIGGYRVANTRLRVWLLTPKGRLLTVRDGHIKVSIARIRSGALPGLKGVL